MSESVRSILFLACSSEHQEILKSLLLNAPADACDAPDRRFAIWTKGWLKDHDPREIDAVLLDVACHEGLSAETRLKRVQRRFPGVPLLTFDDDDSFAVHALEAGAHEHLRLNTISPESLERSLRFARARCRRRDAGRAGDTALRRITENNVDGMLVVDAGGFIRFANPAARRMLGRERHEVVGHYFGLASSPEELSELSLVPYRSENAQPVSVESRMTAVSWQGKPAWLYSLRDVTERRRHECDLALLAAIVESSEVAIISKTLEGVVTSWNRGAERIYGYTSEEAVGQSIDLIVPEDARDQLQQILKAVSRGEVVVDSEAVRLHKDGTAVYVSLTVSPVRNAGGEIIGASAIARDVTARKRTEAALADREERLRLALSAGGMGTWDWDPELNVTHIDHREAVLCGLPPETRRISAEEFFSLVHPEDEDDFRKRNEITVRDGGSLEGEFRIIRPDGEVRWLASRGVAIRDETGKVSRMIGVNFDVTQRKRQERTLREQQEHIRLILDSTAEAIYGLDLDGRCTFCNNACVEMLGYDGPDDLLGKNMHVVMHHSRVEGESYSVEECPISRSIRSGEPAHSDDEVFWRSNGTYFPAEYWSHPIRREGRIIGAVVTFLDVTERKRAAAAIKLLNAELERKVETRTAKLQEAVDDLEAFSYSVSHDLRAPLRHIAGFVDLLNKRCGDRVDDVGRRYIETIRKAACSAGEMIDDLLAFSRMGRQALRVDEVDMHDLAEQVRDDLAHMARDRVVEWRIADLPVVRGDETLLKLVLQNLFENALKYSAPRNAAQISIAAERGPAETVFSVSDNGVGFEMEYSDKLFGVFQRLHGSEEFEGTGIGLASVSRIVGKHRGKVWAESTAGEGATFYFSLPDVNGRPPEPAAVDADSQTETGSHVYAS